MWVLSCDEEEIWQGKRFYCLPGQSYTLGRVAAKGEPNVSASMRQINARNGVSRKHLIIQIDHVKPGEGVNIHTRSKVTIEESSKKGTWVDGVDVGTKLHNDHMVLDKPDHTFHLGSSPYPFRLSWEPQTITFMSAAKKKIAPYQEKLEKFDIKTVSTFVHGETNLVCVDKRNTPKGLQALVNGVLIVTAEYVDALVATCTRPEEEELSPAEQDVDGNWPDPTLYLPPPGTEPVKRDGSLYAPDSRRQNMMEGYVVYVNANSQAESFRATVLDAGGKLEYFPLIEKKTKPLEFTRLVEKHQKRIIMRDNTASSWHTKFYAEVSKALNLTIAEQNEFLDAILMVDVGALCRPLVRDDHRSTQSQLRAPPPTAESRESQSGLLRKTSDALHALASSNSSDAEASMKLPAVLASRSTSPEPVSRPTRSFASRTQVSSAKVSQPYSSRVHDDDDDDDSDFEVLPPPGQRNIQNSIAQSQRPVASGSKATWFNSRSTQLSAVPGYQSQGRKRSLVEVQEEEDEDAPGDVMDELLPGAALMKKRRLEKESREDTKDSGDDLEEVEDPSILNKEATENGPSVMEKTTGKSKRKPGIADDEIIKQAAGIRAREAKEAAERARAEAKHYNEDEEDVAKFKNLAIVEDFEVLSRDKIPLRRDKAYGDNSDRWDPRWNGRKNFKKFKKRLANPESQMRRLAGPVVVSLVEHKRNDYGISDGFMDSSSKKTSIVTHISETQFLPNGRSQRDTDTQTSATQLDSVPSTRTSKRSQPSNSDGPVVKKQKLKKTPFVQKDDDDDSENELKFRF